MSGKSDGLTKLGNCSTKNPYTNSKAGRGLLLKDLKVGVRYLVKACVPVDLDKPATSGFRHVQHSFVFGGLVGAHKDAVNMEMDDGSAFNMPAHALGLMPLRTWDGNGDNDKLEGYGKWNHFSVVTLAPKR